MRRQTVFPRPRMTLFNLAGLLLTALLASVRAGSGKYNISYSVLEETDGPALIGDLAGDLNLLRFYSSDNLAKKRVEFLRTSPDYNSHFRVRIVPGKAGGTVRHELMLVKRLDRELVCKDSALASECYLALSCSVKPYDDPILLFTVRIFVLDVNDNAPVFDPAQNTVQFSEADLVGSRKPIPHAADADSGPNARVAYALATPSNHFRVDSDSQTQVYLTLASPLDRETVASYSLNVSATDFGDVPLTGYLQLSVVVTDTNDCFPVFDRESYHAKVVENSMPKPVLTVHATDGDIGENGRVKYQLASDTLSRVHRFVEVGLEDGAVSLRRPIDREELAVLEFQVRAVDGGSPAKTSVATVQLTVLDLNDCPPRIELPARRTGVFENRQPGTVVLSFTVKDDDLGINGSVQCKLDQGARSEFEVKEYDRKLRLFQILTRDELDREAKDTYSVVIRCTDGGGMESREGLTIFVEDENDHQPRFVQTTLFRSVPENCALGHVIANLSATDGDINENGLISYYIQRDPAVPETNSFDVTRHGGTVTVSKRLDREARSSLTLFVEAGTTARSISSRQLQLSTLKSRMSTMLRRFCRRRSISPWRRTDRRGSSWARCEPPILTRTMVVESRSTAATKTPSPSQRTAT
ncbi:hypothetical protein BOX15_Mlig018123g1 [Macrostomum lignano]|uniref:Cadherin domain-containing protein n=1 Tax=Macrostomum lignano TaxID=282301 RepID=A0A267DBM7_9PLAT|nr:hypothetical protein BOX15_Mlig018123g1 [Macrostomum lignano]